MNTQKQHKMKLECKNWAGIKNYLKKFIKKKKKKKKKRKKLEC